MNLSSRTLVGKLLRLPLRLIPGSAVVPVLKGPLRGARWVVGSMPHGAWLGTIELHMLRDLAGRLRAGMTVYDLGANVGLYTLAAARAVGAEGRVYAFEPLPRNVSYLKRHLALNKLTNTS